jgi:hypothetical protein
MGVRARIWVASIGATVVAVVVGAPAFSASTQPVAACGSVTQRTITAAYETTTRDIYDGEVASPEVAADLAHVTSAAYLGRAVAADDAAAVAAAATRLVYTRGWHIVRLRVLSKAGALLADVGGPYVLAPVRGKLRYNGAVVGSFVMSVQDDLGYEKLVTRFTGLPIELYRGGAPLMGRDFPATQAPATPPANGTPISVNGRQAVTAAYDVLAFPDGETLVVLAIPRATTALRHGSCAAVNAVSYGAISAHLARLFALPTAAAIYVRLDHEFDSAKLMFVRAGSTQVASSGGPGPVSIPESGSVSYEGQDWIVYSFTPVPALRVYILFPAKGQTGGPTGATGTT